MKRCICCLQLFQEPLTWRTIIYFDEKRWLCPHCQQQLQPIQTPHCLRCFRPLNTLSQKYIYNQNECIDCYRWKKRFKGEDVLEKNISLYVYNSFLKEWLTLYKFKGDAHIAIFFAEKLARAYKKYFQGYVPVEIPLSKKRLQERRFNQSALLLQGWAKKAHLLQRHREEKQSKRRRAERIARFREQPFSLRKKVNAKRIVLIDDIYTTGTTVRQAAQLLKAHGVLQIASLTVAR